MDVDVYAMTAQLSGTVHVGAFSSVMTRLVVPAIRALEQRAPGVRLQVHEAAEPDGLVDLWGGELDVLLVEDETLRTWPRRAGLESRWLLDDPYRVVLPVTWPVPRNLADLADRPWIVGQSGAAAQLVLDRIRSSTGLSLPAAHACTEFPSVLALVQAGLGAAIVPDLALPVAERPGIRTITLPGFGVRHLGAVTTSSRHQPPLLTAALDAFTEAAGST